MRAQISRDVGACFDHVTVLFGHMIVLLCHVRFTLEIQRMEAEGITFMGPDLGTPAAFSTAVKPVKNIPSGSLDVEYSLREGESPDNFG